MSRNTIHVDATPQAVYDVLADPRHYANWVVGASATRAFEGRWPEPGSVLHHTQVLLVRDTTTVIESDPPNRLLLEARARPVVVSTVDVRLDPEAGGTRVVLQEEVTGGLMALLPDAVTDALLRLRNWETMRRLKALAEMGVQMGRQGEGAGTAG